MIDEAYKLTTMRTLTATNGLEEQHKMAVYRRSDDGSFWLHDVSADPNHDALMQLEDYSDTAITDAISVNGFEID